MAFTSRPLSRNDRGAPQNYRRKFTISAHAVERYRERVDVEFQARDDQDLGNMLDEKLQHPERAKREVERLEAEKLTAQTEREVAQTKLTELVEAS